MRKSIILIISLIVSGLIMFAIWWFTRPDLTSQNSYNTISNVTTLPVKVQAMPIILPALGTVQAQQAMTVISQVTGVVNAIHFREGQMIKKGDPLITLDATTFKLELQKAQADLQRSKVELVPLQAVLKRCASLLKLGFIAPKEYEKAYADTQAQKADIMLKAAEVKKAQTQLDCTQIKASISGKTGSLAVKVGDLVTANTATLVTIKQLDPVLVQFSIPQSQLHTLLHYKKAGSLALQISAQSAPLLNGKLMFIDNTIDKDTDTIMLKALFSNPQHSLWPGQTVPLTIILAIQDKAIVVPSRLLQIDQQGHFLYLADHGKARVQHVVIDRELGDLTVIKQGLKGIETALDRIPANLIDGGPIAIVKPTL